LNIELGNDRNKMLASVFSQLLQISYWRNWRRRFKETV
jgi:hypothetical protein